MADWDPFADPADGGDADSQAPVPVAEKIDYAAKVTAVLGADAGDAPLNPWEDDIYVELSREAAREAAEREAAAREAAERRAEERLRAEREAAEQEVEARERRVAAREAKRAAEAAKALSPEERKAAHRRSRIEEAAYWEALEAVRGATKAAAAKRQAALEEYYEKEAAGDSPSAPSSAVPRPREAGAADDGEGGGETGFREAAAQMMAAQMGIKINVRSLAPTTSGPVGLLFPDQGSRSLRLLSAARNLPGVPQMLHSLRDLLGFDPLEEAPIQGVWELFRGPEAIPVWLEETELCQPVMFVSHMAAIERLKQRRPGCLEQCRVVAGLSLGELAALTYAGVFDFETGLQLARLRGEAMQAAAGASPQRILSVAGLDSPTLERLCGEAAAEHGEVCQIAQRLFPSGFVCSGGSAAVEGLLQKARAVEGCKQVSLLKPSLGGGFHTPLMEPARERMRQALKKVGGAMRPPRCDVFMGTTGEKITAATPPAEIVRLLCDQLTNCVHWEQSVRGMMEEGVRQFYECGPMQQLKGVMKRIDEEAFEAMVCMDHIVKNEKEKRK